MNSFEERFEKVAYLCVKSFEANFERGGYIKLVKLLYTEKVGYTHQCDFQRILNRLLDFASEDYLCNMPNSHFGVNFSDIGARFGKFLVCFFN